MCSLEVILTLVIRVIDLLLNRCCESVFKSPLLHAFGAHRLHFLVFRTDAGQVSHNCLRPWHLLLEIRMQHSLICIACTLCTEAHPFLRSIGPRQRCHDGVCKACGDHSCDSRRRLCLRLAGRSSGDVHFQLQHTIFCNY